MKTTYSQRAHHAAGRLARAGVFLFAVWAAFDCAAEEIVNTADIGVADRRPMQITITGTRAPEASFDLPISMDRIDRAEIQDSTAKVDLSEPLIRVPGVVAQNRHNYAQDVQISVRGFGARASFGVRGVRLYADGIPATMPDGQGQTSNFDLSSAAHIEVLRGPFSALYGNSSGGVIALFTEDGQPGFALTPSVQLGSHGRDTVGVKAAGENGIVNYVANGTRFRTDGYREHSAAIRHTANAKLRTTLNADTTVTLVANAVDMPEIQDPLGLARTQFESDPRSAHPNAINFNTRKSVRQQQFGLRLEKTLTKDNSVQAMVYGGERSAIQYLAIPVAAQAPPTSAGGVIDLSRQYSGIDIRFMHLADVGARDVQWTAGVNYDNLDEHRRGYENFSGTTLGVRGNLRRDEQNDVYNFDQYIQGQWEPNRHWLLLAGVRQSEIRVRSQDHYIAPGNGDDSGSTHYRALSPVLGATFKATAGVNLYAAYGEGFETPTLNELSYRAGTDSPSGFNFDLRPAYSENYEAGIKAYVAPDVRANLAVFHIDTEDEIVVAANTNGRAVFQNAGATRRNGVEAALTGAWANGLGAVLSYTRLQAEYAQSFCSGTCTANTQVAAGNRIPGVPRDALYGELSWRPPARGLTVAMEGKYNSKTYVDDINSDAAPSYTVLNLRAVLEQTVGAWRVREFVRIDNVGDRHYAGSVIVNEGNQRFFEPAPGRSYLFGVSASYRWQ